MVARWGVLAALCLAGHAAAQVASRSLAVDILSAWREQRAAIMLEPAAWNHVTLRLGVTLGRRDVDDDVIVSDFGYFNDYDEDFRAGRAGLRFYPVALERRPRERVLPFVGVGVTMAERRANGAWCIAGPLSNSPRRSETECVTVGVDARHVTPVAEAGLRLVPGRFFADLVGELRWGDAGKERELPHRDLRLRGGLAFGYTW